MLAKKIKKIILTFFACWFCLLFWPIVPAISAAPSIILLKVPFTAQAPLANWRDPKQQDACEEAAALMAVSWAKRQKLGAAKQVEKQIIALTDFELKKYGGYQDTSAQDTVKRIFQDYFHYNNATSTIVQSVSQIIKQLQDGNLVIAPVNGQKLKNPYYTRPGPERHMLLIKGYDFAKKEFITNDAGTRHGNNYRYPVNILENALRDYPTGDKKPIKEIKKAIIIVRPE
jgi:hypothetical protein